MPGMKPMGSNVSLKPPPGSLRRTWNSVPTTLASMRVPFTGGTSADAKPRVASPRLRSSLAELAVAAAGHDTAARPTRASASASAAAAAATRRQRADAMPGRPRGAPAPSL